MNFFFSYPSIFLVSRGMELPFLRKQVYYGEKVQPTKQPLPNTKDHFVAYPVMIPSISPHYAVRTDLLKEAPRNNIPSSPFLRDFVSRPNKNLKTLEKSIDSENDNHYHLPA